MKWSHSIGDRPHTVRVYDRPDRRGLYMKYHGRKEALGHSDRKRAKQQAAEKHAELLKGHEEPGSVTLGGLFNRYLRDESPTKARPEDDERAAELWRRFLGPGKDPHAISRREWDAFVEVRGSGAIDARGNRVPESAPCPDCEEKAAVECQRCAGTGRVNPRQSVGNRTIAKDVKLLSAVLAWGVRYRLLRENATAAYDVPVEKNPRRGIATRERYEATLAVAAQVSRSLSTLLTLAAETGRRIGAIRQLRADDLRLERTRQNPHGAIRWPAETDKLTRSSLVPLNPPARAALEEWLAERPVVGRAYLFPAPTDPEKPVDRYLAARWLQSAEKLAGLEPLDGTLWHAYRRMFAMELKHLPVQDVAFLGGWTSVETVMQIYQQHDTGTVLRALTERRELRHAL